MNIQVSHSYRCDNETRTLGESAADVREVDRRRFEFDAALCALALTADSPKVRKIAHKLQLALFDICHDEEWPSLVAECNEAEIEADVRPVVRSAAE